MALVGSGASLPATERPIFTRGAPGSSGSRRSIWSAGMLPGARFSPPAASVTKGSNKRVTPPGLAPAPSSPPADGSPPVDMACFF